MYVEGETTLSLMLSESGAINRVGDGSRAESGQHQLCMGHTEEELFESAMNIFVDEWLEMSGRYEFPNPKGELCKLTINSGG